MSTSGLRDPAALAALWLAVIALVGPGGDFPLSDDWAYAHASRSLCEQGSLDLLPWTGASLLFQAGYGAVLCKLFGLSFEVLRASTLVLAMAGVLACRALLLTVGAPAAWALFGAFVLLANPIWINLSFTFMTDIPFAVFAVAAVWLYARGLQQQNSSSVVAGSRAAAAAMLIRQHGMFIAAAAALTALLDAEQPWKRRLQAAGAAVAIPLVAGLLYIAWLLSAGAPPEAVTIKLRESVGVTPLRVADAAFRGIVTIGSMLLPLAVALPLPRARREAVVAAACAAALTAVAAWLYLAQGDLFPYLINVLHASGIGALTMRDVFFLGVPNLGVLPVALRALLTLACILAVARLAAWQCEHSRLARSNAAKVAGLAFVLLFLGSLLQTRYYFDRYLIALLPIGMAAIAQPHGVPPPRAWVAAALVLALSVAGTHDYMSWNRARWDLLRSLEDRGVTAASIDGGMEYNAWRLAAELRTWPSDAQARPRYEPGQKSWWWVVDDEYVVAFGPLPGYHSVETREYPAWLPGQPGRLTLLRRGG